jgi:colanic acid biosynthesis glycosyl transferase WcaI
MGTSDECTLGQCFATIVRQNRTMRISFINQYFPPDASASAYLLGELAEDLAHHHEIVVIAGRPSYSVGSSTFSPAGVTVRYSWSTSFSRSSMPGRLVNYGSFLLGALLRAVLAGRPDVIVALTDPPAIGLVGLIAARRHRVPLVYVCQDIFPDVAVALGKLRKRPFISAWQKLNALIRKEASRVVAIGRDMEQKLLQEGVERSKLSLIRNWGFASAIDPLDARAERRTLGWEGRFIVMHAGNLGLAQNPSVLVAATAALRGTLPEMLLVFVGDGASRVPLEEEVERRGLRNVVFLPYQPKEQAQRLMAMADVHVVSLAPGLWGCVAPSKVYGIMAAGRPFIAAVDPGSEPALIAEEHGCGLVVPPDDPAALAKAIEEARDMPLDEMGRRGREAFERLYDRPIGTTAYRRLLEEVVSGG